MPPTTSPPVPSSQIFAGGRGYTGNSIVDFLKQAGQATDYNSRAQLAAKYGVSNYTGTAAQNTQLLNTLRGATSAPQQYSQPIGPTTASQQSAYAPAAGYNGSSVVDFLNQAGQRSDFNSRAQLAQQYGISNYTGTANQNTQLLGVLRGFAGGRVSPLGIPSTVAGAGAGGITPTTPINASALSGGNLGDLSKILGANVANGTASSDIAGLLSLYGATTESQKEHDKFTGELTAAMGSLGSQGADLQAELDRQGVASSYQQVKELTLKAAQMKGELEKFDAETTAGLSNLQNNGAVTQEQSRGFENQYSRQRDLTRLAKAADLSATVGLMQAYQGNAQLGLELATKAIELKYAPILNQISVLKTQLGIAGDKMTREDNNRTKIIGALLDLKVNEINQQKDSQTQIQSMAIQAAANGAPLSVVNAIRNAADPIAAAAAGSTFLKGSLESISSGGAGGTAGTAALKLTASQKSSLAEGNTLVSLANEALTLGEQIDWAGVGGFGLGSIKGFLAKNLGLGSAEAEQLRNLIGNIAGTLAKARGGTSFTENEQRLLERYTPTINDSPLVIRQKLEGLISYIKQLNQEIINTAGGSTSTSSSSLEDYLGQLGL